MAVAEDFARCGFAEPREVDGPTFRGDWKGGRFLGTFRLVDGTRPYRITGDTLGNWTIEWD